jgi:hypothetical protein
MNTIIIKQNSNYSKAEFINKEDEIQLNRLINIIFYNYKNFPNYVHFFNIRNIINFLFKNEEKSEIKKIIMN